MMQIKPFQVIFVIEEVFKLLSV